MGIIKSVPETLQIPKSPGAVDSPDGQLVITFIELGDPHSTLDYTIRAKLQSKADQEFIASLGKAQYAVFSPDGKLIVTLSPDGKARLFNQSGRLLKRFKHPERVWHAEFREAEGGQYLVLNKNIFWAIRGVGIKELAKHQSPVLRVSFAEGTTGTPLVLTSTQSQIARLWDLSGQLLAEITHPAPSERLNTTFARFSPSGKYFATWSDFTAEDGYPKMTFPIKKAFVRLWNLQGNQIVELEHKGMLTDVVISPDGEYLLTLPEGSGPILWDKAGNLLHTYEQGSYFYSAAFVPGQRQFLTSKNENSGRGELWDFEGNLCRSLPIAGSEAQGYVAYPVFSPDGLHFLSYNVANVSSNVDVSLWHFEQGQLIKCFLHKARVFSAVFSPDQPYRILTASADGLARLWSQAGDLLQSFPHEGPVYSAQFSPDGQFVVTASADGTAKLWDLNGNVLADLNKHAGEVYSAVFSPDGRFICTGSEDGSARLWPTPHTIKAWIDSRPPRQEGETAGKAR